MTLYILFMALGLVLIGLGVILFFIPILGALLLWSGQAMLIVNTVYRIHFFYSLSLDVDAVCIGDGRESGSYVAAAGTDYTIHFDTQLCGSRGAQHTHIWSL